MANNASLKMAGFDVTPTGRFCLTDDNDTKLPELLILKYNAIADARDQLGEISAIRETFIGFQASLYEARAAG